MDELIEHIEHSASKLLTHPTFKEWAEPITWAEGDLLLINNSFVFRDVSTTKSSLYLAYTVDAAGGFTNLCVAAPSGFNSDFRRIPKKGAESLSLSPLSKAVRAQHDNLGKLVYLIIGQIDDSIVQSVPVDIGSFQYVTWDPTITSNCRVQTTSIVVRQTFDEESLWQVVLSHLPESLPRDEAKQKFGDALDQLQDMAVAHLRLPRPGATPDGGVTSAICNILSKRPAIPS